MGKVTGLAANARNAASRQGSVGQVNPGSFAIALNLIAIGIDSAVVEAGGIWTFPSI
jgi:hypothetical protein